MNCNVGLDSNLNGVLLSSMHPSLNRSQLRTIIRLHTPELSLSLYNCKWLLGHQPLYEFYCILQTLRLRKMRKWNEQVGQWVWQGCVHTLVAMQQFSRTINITFTLWFPVFKLQINEHLIFKSNPLDQFLEIFSLLSLWVLSEEWSSQ